mmetsp:Transcript_7318/g.13693  ORF Transcript_7318/g.13693 Transcript_7318/m.13693 type:complete len:245 (+) Transcript_7318:1168-1902(+)
MDTRNSTDASAAQVLKALKQVRTTLVSRTSIAYSTWCCWAGSRGNSCGGGGGAINARSSSLVLSPRLPPRPAATMDCFASFLRNSSTKNRNSWGLSGPSVATWGRCKLEPSIESPTPRQGTNTSCEGGEGGIAVVVPACLSALACSFSASSNTQLLNKATPESTDLKSLACSQRYGTSCGVEMAANAEELTTMPNSCMGCGIMPMMDKSLTASCSKPFTNPTPATPAAEETVRRVSISKNRRIP